MKKYPLLLISFLLYLSTQACTFAQDPFCWALAQFPERNLLTGVIVAEDSTGIDFAVLEVLRGEESRSTIRIWDGTDFECNGTWSMAAADIGDLQDTFILLLPRIDSIENDWEVLGDYRRQGWHFDFIELQVEGEVASGFIAYDSTLPRPNQRVYSYPYEALRSAILTTGECPRIVSTQEPAQQEVLLQFNNPCTSSLQLQFTRRIADGELYLYAADGKPVHRQPIAGQSTLELDLSHLPAGLYFLEVRQAKRRQTVRKLMKL